MWYDQWLLKPERINAYAQAVIRTLQADEEEGLEPPMPPPLRALSNRQARGGSVAKWIKPVKYFLVRPSD